MYALSDLVPELIYSVFSVFDNALSTVCVVWLCWQVPVLGRRPFRALCVAGLLLFGTPLIASVGYCVSHLNLRMSWTGLLFRWHLLWTATAIPVLILAMVLIRRITGIVMTRSGLMPSPRQAISIGDLFVWTLVVAIVFAISSTVSTWIDAGMASFNSPLTGTTVIGFIIIQVLPFAASTYFLSPNLMTSIWLRAIVAYSIFTFSRASIILIHANSGDTSVNYFESLINESIQSVSVMLGIVLGHRILMARGYQYSTRPKTTRSSSSCNTV